MRNVSIQTTLNLKIQYGITFSYTTSSCSDVLLLCLYHDETLMHGTHLFHFSAGRVKQNPSILLFLFPEPRALRHSFNRTSVRIHLRHSFHLPAWSRFPMHCPLVHPDGMERFTYIIFYLFIYFRILYSAAVVGVDLCPLRRVTDYMALLITLIGRIL